MDTYEQAVEYLFGRINYERLQAGRYSVDDFKLDRMRQLLALLGDPHERLPVVHVAGTKGKGSTAVMIAEALSAAGYRTGLFTSPHISRFEERLRVDGEMPGPQQVVDLTERVADAVAFFDRQPGSAGPTFFEIVTAMAWLYFVDQAADFAVLEVGLGGRLDATSVCNPLVSVITNVSRDHTQLLGGTLADIAREKSGIIKPRVPVVTGVDRDEPLRVVEQICRERNTPLLRLDCEIGWRLNERPPNPEVSAGPDAGPLPTIDVTTPFGCWERIPVPLAGRHQARNAALAVAALSVVNDQGRSISIDAARKGMQHVHWPLRIEVLRTSPTVVVDAAHNWASVGALLETLRAQFPSDRRILIFAATKEKDVRGMLRRLLPEFQTVILTEYQNNPRAVGLSELSQLAQSLWPPVLHEAPNPTAAWKLAMHLARPDDLICATGSFFIAAELRDVVLDEADRHPTSHTRPSREDVVN